MKEDKLCTCSRGKGLDVDQDGDLYCIDCGLTVSQEVAKAASSTTQAEVAKYLPEPFSRYVNDVHCYDTNEAVDRFAAALKESWENKFALSQLIVKHNLSQQQAEVAALPDAVQKKFDFVIGMWKDPSNEMDGLHTLETLKAEVLAILNC